MSVHQVSALLLQAADDGDALAGRSHGDRVLRAIADLYGDPACLVSHEDWCGDRIYVVDSPDTAPLERAWPLMMIAPDFREDTDDRFAAAGDDRLRVLITLYLHEYDRIVADGELSMVSIHKYLARWITRDRETRCLVTPRYPSRGLLQEPLEIGSWDVATVELPDPQAEEGFSIVRAIQMTVSTKWTVAQDGQPQGWAADD